MHVITRKRLNEFAEKYPETRTALANWYDLVRSNDFSSLPNLKLMFPTADQVGKLTVFNVGGNNYRIITVVFYEAQRVYIAEVLTHEEYNKDSWKERL